jgi:hypothetical protein
MGLLSNCVCILVLTTLKMATGVAETCRRLICNYNNSSKCIWCSFFKKIVHLCNAGYMKHIKLRSHGYFDVVGLILKAAVYLMA